MNSLILQDAEYLYNKNQDQLQLFVELNLTDNERGQIKKEIRGRRGPFFAAVRKILKIHDKKQTLRKRVEKKHANSFVNDFKRAIRLQEKEKEKQQTFMDICDSIEHLLCKDHILRHGRLDVASLKRVARRIGIGGMGELPKSWSGLVSEEAEKNTPIKEKMFEATYLSSEFNTQEHFYNMQYAGMVILIWILEYEYDKDTFIKLCDVFRQVHITTREENRRAANNGQNDIPHITWQEVYNRNNIKLKDVGLKEVNILNLEDVAPEGLLDLVDKIFAED